MATIFGCIIGRIQQKMLEVGIQQIKTNQDIFFSDTDAAYFTVPRVANSIVQASARNTLTNKVNALAHNVSRQVYSGALAIATL